MERTASSFLIIQTAFIGDVILATALVEKIKFFYPHSPVDFLVRKGNEDLLTGNPRLRHVYVWDKKKGKIKNLFKIAKEVRKQRYDFVINPHRFGSSGFVTAFSNAKRKIGFDKNPFSFSFDLKIKHEIGHLHEVERNQKLIASITDSNYARPTLYPSASDYEKIRPFQQSEYVCVAPTSVWFTKQFPVDKWISLIQEIQERVGSVYLLGASSDRLVCENIRNSFPGSKVTNLAGSLSFLESAALMKGARMNYVNDSAPMHLASSVNAPVTAIYCSTVPAFGFGPLSEKSFVVETKEKLECRPCGLHGHRQCPQKHFRCATSIEVQELEKVLAK